MNFNKNIILIVDDTHIHLKVLIQSRVSHLSLVNARCLSKIVSSSGNIFLRLL